MTTPSPGVEAMIGLSASIETLSGEMARTRKRLQALAQGIHPFVISGIPVSLTAGAGTLSQPNILGPRSGYYWDIKRLGATGFSAGTVNTYLNSINGDLVVPFTAAGVTTFGTGQLLIGSNDFLVFSAASITGTVTIALAGIEIAAPFIGDYLL